MATAFTDEEKKVIKKKLHTVAKECLQRYGVKKTTDDQMVVMANISKFLFFKRNAIFHSLRRISNRHYESFDRTIRTGKSEKYKSVCTVTIWFLSGFSLFVYVYHIQK